MSLLSKDQRKFWNRMLTEIGFSSKYWTITFSAVGQFSLGPRLVFSQGNVCTNRDGISDSWVVAGAVWDGQEVDSDLDLLLMDSSRCPTEAEAGGAP